MHSGFLADALKPASARAEYIANARADAGWEQSQNWRMHPHPNRCLTL